MLRRPARNRFVAWLAMLAICLLASAPTASRVIAAASAPAAAPVLSGGVEHAHAGHADSHGEQHADDQHPDDGHADHMDACGYCTLAAHGSTLADAIVYTVPMLPAAPLAVAMDHRDVHVAAVRCPPARGPPLALASLGG